MGPRTLGHSWSTMSSVNFTMINNTWPWSTMFLHHLPWSALFDHGQQWSIMVILTIIDHDLDHGQPFFSSSSMVSIVDHGQQWSIMVIHGQDHHWPWPRPWQLIAETMAIDCRPWITMVKHGLTWSTMVVHDLKPWSFFAWVLAKDLESLLREIVTSQLSMDHPLQVRYWPWIWRGVASSPSLEKTAPLEGLWAQNGPCLEPRTEAADSKIVSDGVNYIYISRDHFQTVPGLGWVQN